MSMASARKRTGDVTDAGFDARLDTCPGASIVMSIGASLEAAIDALMVWGFALQSSGRAAHVRRRAEVAAA